MTSAPEAFMAVANATAAIVQKAPAYISYHVSGVAHFRHASASIARDVIVRTVDGDAVVHDARSGRDEVRPPFPAPPTFNALARWRIDGSWSVESQGGAAAPDVDLRVTNIEPRRFGPTVTHADVVVRSVRGYRISYAAPAAGQTHLHLEPTPEYFRGSRRTGWLSEVWFDPATLIPSRIVCNGNDGFRLDARYAIVDGVWLLRSIDVGWVLRPLAGLARISESFSGEFGDYRFSETTPDPRIGPAASASPATTGRTLPMSFPEPSRS
jgi:hypothetical protein